MDRAEARARQHRENRLGHRRHVDEHPIAAIDAQPAQRACQRRNPIEELVIGEGLDRARDGTVMNQGKLFSAPALDVPIDGVVAGIEHRAREPAHEGRARVVQHPIPPPGPRNGLGGRAPKGLRIAT